MKNKHTSEKGITLISLVVTIILLIILAGISINFILDENGLIIRGKKIVENQKEIELIGKLELEKLEAMKNKNGKISLEEYLEQLKNKGIINNSDIEEANEENGV